VGDDIELASRYDGCMYNVAETVAVSLEDFELLNAGISMCTNSKFFTCFSKYSY
jgi:hypothetical protein